MNQPCFCSFTRLSNIAMVFRWPIEIDGLPSYKMGGFSMAMLNNQMVNEYIICIKTKEPATAGVNQ